MLMMSSEQFPLVAGRNQIKWSLVLCFFCLEKRRQTLMNFLQCWEIQRPVLVQLLQLTRSQMLAGLHQTLLCSDHHHKPRTVAELKRKK